MTRGVLLSIAIAPWGKQFRLAASPTHNLQCKVVQEARPAVSFSCTMHSKDLIVFKDDNHILRLLVPFGGPTSTL